MNNTVFYKIFPLIMAIFFSGAGMTTAQPDDPLRFPKDQFTVESGTVKTSGSEKKVAYRAYMHIPYVAKPVDKDYQSLNVFVPVEINGKNVDATHSPILFSIGVGGYMSVNNSRSSSATSPGQGGGGSSITDLALAAGFVVVSPGCLGRDNKATDGTHYGKAPHIGGSAMAPAITTPHRP